MIRKLIAKIFGFDKEINELLEVLGEAYLRHPDEISLKYYRGENTWKHYPDQPKTQGEAKFRIAKAYENEPPYSHEDLESAEKSHRKVK